MNVEDILLAAEASAPDLMDKTAQSLAILERMDPEVAEEVVSDFIEIVNVTLEKTSAAGAVEKSLAKRVGEGMVMMGAAGFGMAIANDLFNAAKRGLTKGTNFKRMMDANPHLKELDPKAVKSAYNTLHHYAPDFTADPNLGGQLLHSMVEVPQNQATLVKDLIRSSKELHEANKIGGGKSH